MAAVTICSDFRAPKICHYFNIFPFYFPWSNGTGPDVQAGFRKGRGTRDEIANIRWIIEKAREFKKNIYFCFIDYAKAFDCVDHSKYQTTLPASWEICIQVKKQQLELDMEQQTCSK